MKKTERTAGRIVSLVLLTATIISMCVFASCEQGTPSDTTLPEETTTIPEDTTGAEETPLHKVILNTNGGKYVPIQRVEDGDTVLAPTPVRSGYDFDGWYSVSGEKFDLSTPVTADTELVARWKHKKIYAVTDTSPVAYSSNSAALNVVWKDYDNSQKKRPEKITATFTSLVNGKTLEYPVIITESGAKWDGNAPDGAKLSQGEGSWTAKITGLDSKGTYSFTAEALKGDYSTLQSGTSVTYTVKSYKPLQDPSAWLMTTNGRLYDRAGNLIVLRGLVSLNLGYNNFDTLTSLQSLKAMQKYGVNCLRFSVQVDSTTGTNGYALNQGRKATDDERAAIEAKVDEAVKTTSMLGMYVIIDWGFVAQNPNEYFDDAALFFGKLADKYKANPYVMFEIGNEPKATWGTQNGESESIKAYSEKMIRLIREKAPDNVIVVAANYSTTALSMYSTSATAGDDPVDDPIRTELMRNVAFSFHCYPYNYPYFDSAVTSYSWKLRDALQVGYTIISTEMSPIKANLTDGRDETLYDLNEAAKYLNFYLENDLSIIYFRYNFSGASSALSQWIMFKPGIKPTDPWSRDDLTTCGQWYYDILTSDGVIKAADFSAARHQ